MQSDAAASAAQTVHAGGGANPQRREQKDAVRRVKEKQLRRIQRMDTLRKLGIGIVVIAAVGAGVIWIGSQGTTGGGGTHDAEIDALLKKAGQAQSAAGCSDVKDVGPYTPDTADQQHTGPDFPAPELSTYPSVPPASGPHDGSGTQPAGAVDQAPPIGLAIHSLEHGGAIIWYRPGTQSSAEFAAIRDFVERHRDHTILAPYDYPNEGSQGQLPDGTDMALVAWHTVQTCNNLSLPVVAQFLNGYRDPTLTGDTYTGVAPEKGAAIG